ncbi:hypothetical protein E3P94_00543 [Wallemia ichthyophaga]|nr:hypothetical protein E3P95_02161 [Wallemia ichthyophaga]TIB04554.1 hypothetical protein E3P94_00543 [Wallemia ichthyophaga]
MTKSNENTRKIAVLTSGGDAAGMNAAVRAVAKMGLYRGCEVFIVREGWAGLVAGNVNAAPADVRPPPQRAGKYHGNQDVEGEKFAATFGEGELLQEGAGEGLKGRHILKVGWDDVRGWMDIGGTLIGTARCAEFREKEGRETAAFNLISLGIDALVVIGGDGSLTGADRLRGEWPSLLDDLEKSKRISAEQRSKHAHLTITGIVGSIDNDMAMTDITIGAPTALHRISEAVDSIGSTASSHSRAFVVEVMGRHCGWLAVMAGLACGADYIFIPERPPKSEDWESEMCNGLKSHREHGKRKTIVIVAEGALDRQLKPIKPAYVADILTKRLQLDTRVTTLGHVQRGGKPCAYDRLLATLQGVEAVEAVLDATPQTPSYMIGLKENKVKRVSLMDAVKATAGVGDAIEKKDFDQALQLRDPEFLENLEAFDYSTIVGDNKHLPEGQRLRIGIIHVGAPAGGMNAATREAARFCLARGHTPLAIYNGFEGLWAEAGNGVQPLSWLQVDNWSSRGGSELGTNRSLPADDLDSTSKALQNHNIDALLMIGGYEAYTAIQTLKNARTNYPAFQISMAVIPATLSNNVPLTEFSVGSDTALNALVDACDAIKQSAAASRNRVFVVETQGGKCGYLATVGALATGANIVYTPELGMDLGLVQSDVEFLKRRFALDVKGKSDGRFIIRNEKASSVYSTEFLTNMLKEEGKELFDSRAANLGHTLQGGTPSPIDRARACRLAVRCIKFLEDNSTSRQAGAKDESAAVIVIENGQVRLAPVEDVSKVADDKNRRGMDPWWTHLKHLVEVLSGRRTDDDDQMRLFNKYSSYDMLPGYNTHKNRRRLAIYTDKLRPSASFITGITVASVLFTFLSIFPRAPPSIPYAFEEFQPQKPDCLSCGLDPTVALIDSQSYIQPYEDPGMNKHLTESQCLNQYPGLFYEAERALAYWSERGGITLKHLDKASEKAHGRVVIHNNRMFVKEFSHNDVNTRALATFAAIHEALLTSTEAFPNVEFTFQVQDAGDSEDEPIPTLVLDRTADQPELWLMPDFGFWSWPEPKVGSFGEVRDKAGKWESKHSWSEKLPKLFWRGASLDREIRKQLINAANGYAWSDVKMMDWGNIQPGDLLTMEEHCGYQFLVHVEGVAYSGRLKYLLQCHSVSVMHELKFIQHFHHLLDGNSTSADQNVVVVPLPERRPGSETDPNPWERLPEVMEQLKKNPDRVKRIADNSWEGLRSRYLTPSATVCYWRRLLSLWSQAQAFTVKVDDSYIPYESFMLMRTVDWQAH